MVLPGNKNHEDDVIGFTIAPQQPISLLSFKEGDKLLKPPQNSRGGSKGSQMVTVKMIFNFC